jgi:thymidylate kinase
VSLTVTASAPREVAPAPAAPVTGPAVLDLVAQLAETLATYRIAACQWKGHWKPERWGTGEGDIDLLVDGDTANDLLWLLRRLGFKEGVAPEGVPGTASYFGLDGASGRLVHVHLHHRLLLGRLWATYYRLSIEHAVLGSIRPNGVFPTPSPELELLLLTLDQSLRRSAIDVLLGRGADRVAAAWPALRQLLAQSSRETVDRAVTTHLPALDVHLLERCVAALGPEASTWRAWTAQRALRRALAPYAVRRPPRLPPPLRPRQIRKFSATGGSVIALDGPDGAGKSTAATALRDWLGATFATLHAHFGRPPRSLTTVAVGAALKIARSFNARGLVAHLELARCAATARDRFRLYSRVRRFAAAGGLAICERYPNAGNRELAGPSTAQGVGAELDSRIARRLRAVEARYYERITPPDLLLVLCVDPDTAVRRKTNEPADYVRARAEAMGRVEWNGTRAQLVDAGRPFPEVLADLKRLVWEAF